MSTQPFKLEREMVPIACEWLPAAIGLGPEWCSLTAPMIGNVIPDILFGRFDPTEVQAPAFTYIEASVLSLVHNEPEFAPNDVLSRILLPDVTAARTFRALERKGALKRTTTGTFRVCEDLVAVQMEIVAVELKLKRWREACAQAVSYLSFADRAYVVVDGNQIKLNEAILCVFRNAGIGLVLQFGHNFELVLNSNIQHIMTANRVIAAQKLAKAAMA